MSLRLAQRVQRIRPSPTVSITALAGKLREDGKDIIALSAGEPDFPTPENIQEAACEAIRGGDTKYTAVDGVRSLKEAIQEKFKRDNDLDFELDEIVVSSGAKQSCYNACQALLEAGDEVIIRFSQMLEDELPKHAVATRLTGDDFAILLASSTIEEALDFTTSVRSKGEQLRYLQGDKSLQVTVSIGIASFDAKASDSADALTAARIACDSAKDHGRDRVEVYDQDNQSIIRRYDDMHLVSEIQQTLDTDGFELMSQPIVALAKDNDQIRFEILLRMKDSKGNKVSSDAFFSAAERYQLMPQIDRWVVFTTLSKLGEHSEFLENSGASFAINLSGQSLGDDDILKFIEGEMESSGVPASSLCFEVTESAAVSNRRKAQAFIDALRKHGCRFSLDDFGAGLSSFAYLKNFKVDTLKIDGGFIRDITDNRISESMVAAITQVAKVMKLETVAEYVESKEIRSLIKKLGVDFAQGHAIGKPVPLDGVLHELTNKEKTSSA